MAYKVDKSHLAQQDMFEIFDYLTEKLSAIGAAKRFYDSLHACYSRLKRHPRMYPICRNEVLAAKGFRCATVMNYIVFYTVDEANRRVMVQRIIHGTRDYTRIEL